MANTIRQLQSWANTINGLGINSCETAASSGWFSMAKKRNGQPTYLQNGWNHDGIFSDHIKGRHGCSESQKSNAKLVKNASNSNPSLLVGEYNLAWKAIQQQNFFSSRKDLAELFMSVTGTVVVKSENGKEVIKYYPSKVQNASLLKILLEGGTGTIYKCKDANQCLLRRRKRNDDRSWRCLDR